MGFRTGAVTARASPGGPVFSAQVDPASKQTKKDPGAAEPQAKPGADLMTCNSPTLTPGRWVDGGPFRLPRPFSPADPPSKMSAAKQRLEPGCQEAHESRHNFFRLLARTFPDSPLAHKSFSRCNRGHPGRCVDGSRTDRAATAALAFRGSNEYVLLPAAELPKFAGRDLRVRAAQRLSAPKPQPKSSGTGVSPVYGSESRGCGGPETHGRDARATTRRENLRKLRKLLGHSNIE